MLWRSLFSAQEFVGGGCGTESGAGGWRMGGRWTADVRQMVTDARAGSDKSLRIFLYTNKARSVADRLSESHINRQRLEGTGRDGDG